LQQRGTRAGPDTDPTAAKVLLDEMGRDVQHALNLTGKLAHRIYPPLLEVGGLVPALRAAAVSANVPIRSTSTRMSYPPGRGA
jgi:signal transduction histidine kinase